MGKCVNCKGENFIASKSFIGADECDECGFLKSKSVVNKSSIILPEDPMDALLCESCQ